MIIKNEIRSTKELAIFDIDGTLVRYNTLDALIKEALRIYGIEEKDEYVRMQARGVILTLEESSKKNNFSFNKLCQNWRDTMPFLKKYNVDVKDFAHTMLFLETFYMQEISGVRETLPKIDQLKVCSTNWFFYRQKIKLYKAGIDQHFNRIYTCEKICAKPNIEHFYYILTRENINPTKAVMIGDGFVDMASKNAGIDTILVDYNKDKQRLYPLADAIVTDFQDVARILKR